jgi:hypothetical protein
MDTIRAGGGQWSTIDDVYQGLKDGTIDNENLASAVSGYLMDIYFAGKVPSMAKQLLPYRVNAMIDEIAKVSPKEAEEAILAIQKPGGEPKSKEAKTQEVKPAATKQDQYSNLNEAIKTAQTTKQERYVVKQGDKYTVSENIPEAGTAYLKLDIEGNVETVSGAENIPAVAEGQAQGTTMAAGLLPIPGKQHIPKAPLFDASGDPLANKVQKMYEKADKELYDLKNPSFAKFYEKVKRALVDVSGNLSKKLMDSGDPYMKQVRIKFDLARGASSAAKAEWEKVQDDIYKGLSSSEEELLNQVIQSKRTIAIDDYIDITKKYIEHPDNLGGEAHRRFLDQIPPELFTKINDRANKYFEIWDNLLNFRHREGLLSDEQLQNLEEKGPYSPRWFIQHMEGNKTYDINGQRYNVTESGIKSLDEGSVKMMEKDSRLLLSHGLQSVYGRIFRNRANQALFEMAFNDPNNGIVRLASKPKADETLISAMFNGQRVNMAMKNDFAVEWVKSDPEISHSLANTISWLSGTKILKAFATGYNPAFAVSNLARDIAHIYLTTGEYSSFLPKQTLQIMSDIKAVSKDAILRKGAYQDYIDQGGGMDFLTTQGQITSKTQGVLGEVEKIAGYIGQTSEMLTRLAIRHRAMINGATPEEATWLARNYLDFSKGGNFAKAADTIIPYFNAGIQGTRGIFQAAHRDPQVLAWKAAQIGMLAMGLYFANSTVNKEAYDQVPERDRVNNWIITTPFSYIDKDGNKKYFYAKIAKDQGQRILATVFETMGAMAKGDEVNGDMVVSALKDFLPSVPPDSMPPFLSAAIGYMMNKDLWANQDVWRGPKVNPSEEYTLITHPALVKAGQVAGVSPERTGFVLSQIFTRDNMFTNLVGGGLKMMMEGLPDSDKEMLAGDFVKAVPFAKRFIGETDVFEPYKKETEKIKLDENSKRYAMKRELQGLMMEYFDDKSEVRKKAVSAFVEKQDPAYHDMLAEQVKAMLKTEVLPDRRWWLNVIGMSPEAKAEAYWLRYSKAAPQDQNKLESTAKTLPGFQSDRFKQRLHNLRYGLSEKEGVD